MHVNFLSRMNALRMFIVCIGYMIFPLLCDRVHHGTKKILTSLPLATGVKPIKNSYSPPYQQFTLLELLILCICINTYTYIYI